MSAQALRVDSVGERAIVVTRRFAAPRELVYRAHLEPALIQRWLGTARMDWAVCEVDARVGGTFRYEWTRASDDWRMGIRGTFVELVPCSRIVHRETFDEDWTGGESVVTTSLHEEGPRATRLELHLLYSSEQARDRVLRSPMDEGLGEGYDLLEALLDEVRAG